MRPNVDIQPNSNGLPGIVALEQIVGALLTVGLIAAVAGWPCRPSPGRSARTRRTLTLPAKARPGS